MKIFQVEMFFILQKALYRIASYVPGGKFIYYKNVL